MNVPLDDQPIRAPEWVRLVLDDHLAERPEFFNLQQVSRLRDDIDLDRFAVALTAAIRAHEAMRVRLERSASGDWLVRDSGVPFPEVKVERLPAGNVDAVRREIVRPFDVPGDTYCCARLARIGEESWLFMCRHHAFCDNLAQRMTIDLAARAYQDPGCVLPPDGYFAWVRREQEMAEGPVGAEGRRFWSDRFARLQDWPHAPRKDRDGSVDFSHEPGLFDLNLPWSGETLAEVAAALDSTVGLLVVGAFLRALAADWGADRALAGWTCHGRSGRTRRIGSAMLRDYDAGAEAAGDARTFLRRVRADLNAVMRHPYGFSLGRVCFNDLNDDDVAVINVRDVTNNRTDLFAPDPRACYGSLSDCCELFEAYLDQVDGTLTSEVCVAVRREVDAFEGAREQFDDITVVALAYRGSVAAKSRTFVADLSGVAAALGFVEEALADEPGELQARMLTAADEIISNIVRHSGSPDFTVRIDSADDLVRLTCGDSGRAWNPLTDSVFDPNAPAASRKKGGMGIQIVRRTMDHVLYARRDGRNELMVAKRRSKANV